MVPNQASRTALWAAYFRGYHSAHDEAPKIIDDFLARAIVDDGAFLEQEMDRLRGLLGLLVLDEAARAHLDERRQEVLRLLHAVDPATAAPFPDRASALAWVMHTLMPASLVLSRARYAEDRLGAALERGTRQYVILGAGMDTFAFRSPNSLERLHVFEVDHPATQAFKRSRIADLGWDAPVGLHFIPVDLAREKLATALARAPFDARLHAFFSWMGVICYLSRDAVFATLRSVAQTAPAGSIITFDYLGHDRFEPSKIAPRAQFSMAEPERFGELSRTGLDPSTLGADLARHGLRLEEDLGPSEIQARYFEGRRDGYRAWEHAHLVSAVVV